MNNEDFVSYELAKKLKACGFYEPCNSYYSGNGSIAIREYPQCFNCYKDLPMYSRPTLWQVAKWLREKKEIFVEVTSEALHDWDFFVMELDEDANVGVVRGSEIYPSYEQALSAGIYAAVLQLIDNQKE